MTETIPPEPPEDELSPKPPIEDMPPEEGVEAPEHSDEVQDSEFMSPDEAAADDTVDDAEQPEQSESS